MKVSTDQASFSPIEICHQEQSNNLKTLQNVSQNIFSKSNKEIITQKPVKIAVVTPLPPQTENTLEEVSLYERCCNCVSTCLNISGNAVVCCSSFFV